VRARIGLGVEALMRMPVAGQEPLEAQNIAVIGAADNDRAAGAAFRQIAKLSRGAYFSFDAASAGRLKDLLAAVAVYAAGGYRALADFSAKKGGDIPLLTAQLRG